MPDPDPRWQTIPIRIHVTAAPVIRQALARFYAGGRRPPTDPQALGYMLELLAADFLAGPERPHPLARTRTRPEAE